MECLIVEIEKEIEKESEKKREKKRENDLEQGQPSIQILLLA